MTNPKNDQSCEQSPHGWTLDTLEEYLTSKVRGLEKYFTDLSNERETVNRERFNSSEKAVTTAMTAQEKAISAAMAASEKAILKAEAAAEKRSEASNEIRAAMIDQQKNFADKAQTEFRFGALDQRLDENMKSISKRLELIDASLGVSGGRSQGVGMTMGAIVQVITSVAAIGTIIGLIIVVMRH